ncbi:transposase family protein [Oscillatoria acuminata PCC 6304]|uniref:Transposase family protein n=2 Tax=Oscillatoria acuminata TaxID=118323 RepID=K9TJU9_9CYAN|nr:transposase family protein [Oscillatoria acuminata PCC 6304]
MDSILTPAIALVNVLLNIMPSIYQRDSIQALFGLFLEGNGYPLPQHCKNKSASALSRFLNHYNWSTRAVIKAVRADIVAQIKTLAPTGRRPILYLILDMTTLEKVGQFTGLNNLIRVYNGKRGLHLLVLYILLGERRLPWGFKVYRGKDETPPVQLAIRLLNTLPQSLKTRFEIRILADTAFGSIDFLKWINQHKNYHGIVGIRKDRRLSDGIRVSEVSKRGQQVVLHGIDFPVTLSWYWVKKENGQKEKRFVISTKPLSAVYITMLGRRRWNIEGFFKVAKHRFGLHRFGQGTLKGVYRWIILSMIAYLLAHYACLWSGSTTRTDWGEASKLAKETLFPRLVLRMLLIEIKEKAWIARQQGLDIRITTTRPCLAN